MELIAGNGSNVFDVLFLIGCWEGESKRYRVYNIAEGLEKLGCRVGIMDFAQCGDIVDKRILPKALIFFRAPFDPSKRIVEVLEYCRVKRIKTVFDIDDYVFEPSIIHSIAGVAELSSEQRIDYEWGVRAYRSLMFSCDRVTTTTSFLRDRICELGKDAYIIPNTVNRAQIGLADTILASRQHSDEIVRICYFSGSKTHARDFAQCSDAIQTILRQHRNVHFRLVGLLDLDESWVPFAERIERAGLMEPLDMLRSLAECDINIAPLEEGDMFCEGKSELKFFEAGLVEVPTVASRTAPFAAAIVDGENGLLASSTKEWESKLDQLVRNVPLRLTCGKAARRSTLEKFSTTSAAHAALAAYGIEQPTQAKVKSEVALKIGWIVPGLIIGGGGHRNILRAAYHLERFGHDVRLYFSDTTSSEQDLRTTIRNHFYPFDGPVHRFSDHFGGEDVLMATHWSTVALAESVRSRVGEIMYFVQDFEPAFYPMGSEYILAENTYRKGLYAITSGPWCANILRRDYAMEADSFRFPIDRQIYNLSAAGRDKRSKRILFFAKPEMDRRCFLIGAMALREFHRIKPEYEILFFGSGSAKKHQQDYPVTYLDIVPTLQDLAYLYATSALGLVFSTTNPSLVPYEMMACGLPIIDLDRPGNEVNYDNRRDLAFLVDPDLVRIATDMAALLDDHHQLEARSKMGIEFTETFPNEEEMARRVEALILDRVKGSVKTASF